MDREWLRGSKTAALSPFAGRFSWHATGLVGGEEVVGLKINDVGGKAPSSLAPGRSFAGSAAAEDEGILVDCGGGWTECGRWVSDCSQILNL